MPPWTLSCRSGFFIRLYTTEFRTDTLPIERFCRYTTEKYQGPWCSICFPLTASLLWTWACLVEAVAESHRSCGKDLLLEDLILTVFEALIFFFHDWFTCICEAHRSFHKPTDWYLATIWASSPILSRIYLFFPPNLSWTWAWVFHKENYCIEQSCKARTRATMINCMVPLGERFGLFKGK